MKGIRKKLAGLLVFAMVLGILSPGMTTAVKAAPALEGCVFNKVDLENETITVEKDSELTIKYAALKTTEVGVVDGVLKDGKKEEDLKLKDSDWETAESGGTIDISWVGKTKASAILFKAEKKDMDPVYSVLKFNAQDKNVKVGFIKDKPAKAEELGKEKVSVTGNDVVGNDELGYFYFYTKGSDGKYTVVDPTIVQWKKGTSGSWGPVKDSLGKTLPLFKAKGASLIFRVVSDKAIDVESECDVTCNWPSKEVKYAFKKQAAAPKVTIDYVKGTVSLKAGQEYQLEGVEKSSDKGKWVSVDLYGVKDTKGKVKVPTLLLSDLASKANTSGTAINPETMLTNKDIYRGNLVLKVRTAATSKAIPSKIATVQLKKENLAATEASIDAELSNVSPAATVTVGYKVKTNAESGLVVTRTDTTGVAYEFAYVVSTGAVTNAKTKWTKLPVAKSAEKPTVVAVKTSNKDEEITTKGAIRIRVAGNKASKKDPVAKLYSPYTQVALEKLQELEKEVTVGTVTYSNEKAVVSCKESDKISNNGTITVSVLEDAVSAASVQVKLPFTITNATSKTAKVAKTKAKDGSVAFTVPAALTDSKMEITIDVKKDEKSGAMTGGSTVITVDSDVKFTIEVKVVKSLTPKE